MESLILFVLIGVGSVVYEAIKQGNARQKQESAAPKDNSPSMPPTVAPHRSPGSQSVKSNVMQPKVTPVRKNVAEIIESIDQEGVQTEGAIVSQKVQPASVGRESVKEAGFIDIGIEDLQRSIIMAEVLGKPKALRKNTR